MAIEDFEELLNCELLNVESFGWTPPLLTANFGGGYGAGAITAAYGLRRWSLSAGLLPDLDEYSIDYTLDGDDETDPRFTYFFEFLMRHALRGNKPFIVTDPRTDKKYLVSLEDAANGVDFSALTGKLFSGGIRVTERRVSGVTFNSDGSVALDYTPPSASSLTISGSAPYEGTRTLTCSVTGATSVEFYIDHELLSTDSSSPFTASWATQNYKNGTRTVRARAYDAAGNYTDIGLNVYLENDFIAPTVSFTLPAENATVSGTIDLIVTFADTGGSGIDRIEYYYYDGAAFVYLGDGSPGVAYAYNLDTTELDDGATQFRAIAFDNAGNQSVPAARILNIDNIL